MTKFLARFVLIIFLASLSFARKLVVEFEVTEFQEPELVKAGEVKYPVNSVAYGIVALKVTVDAKGKAEAVKVVRDIVSLTPEAVDAVKNWTFRPAKLDGEPIRSKTTVTVVFNPALNNPPDATLPPLANIEQKQALGFSPPQVVEAVYPKYPIRSVAWGTIVLKLEIDAEGRAQTIETLRDIASLTPEAVRAVKAWKFEPATFDGRQVSSKTAVAFLFRPPVQPLTGIIATFPRRVASSVEVTTSVAKPSHFRESTEPQIQEKQQ
jgi:Gram-negative bacterial TonB protein C-terminal